MRTAIAVAALAVALCVTLLAALVLGTLLGFVPVPEFSDGGYDETTLHSLETTGPACPAERPAPDGVHSRPSEDGRRVSVVGNVSVEGERTGVDASLSEVGPGRYHLSLSRTAGAPAPDCPAETRYNATMNVSRPDDYTVIVTLDGEYRRTLWSESNAVSGSAGASRSASAGGSESDAGASDANTSARALPAAGAGPAEQYARAGE
jgi:hypothetical protein